MHGEKISGVHLAWRLHVDALVLLIDQDASQFNVVLYSGIVDVDPVIGLEFDLLE